jgi:hypothetical protein
MHSPAPQTSESKVYFPAIPVASKSWSERLFCIPERYPTSISPQASAWQRDRSASYIELSIDHLEISGGMPNRSHARFSDPSPWLLDPNNDA